MSLSFSLPYFVTFDTLFSKYPNQLCNMLFFFGILASFLIGISLALIGGGGSILTVPVLVYLFGMSPLHATAYSLFIVGATSLIGAIKKFPLGEVKWKTALIFGIPSIIAVYATRKWLVPSIPNSLISTQYFQLSKDLFIMLLFAILMVAASISMIRSKNPVNSSSSSHFKGKFLLIVLEGALVGTVTGLVGAGGGFLIIPALVLLAKLPMKEAVGTSLLIIAMKSLIGFTGDIGQIPIDWKMLFLVTFLSICGIFIGNYFAKKIDGQKLKKGFGWFVLIMGVYILIKESL